MSVDSAQLRKIFPQVVAAPGPVYIRLLRRNAVKIFDDSQEFTLGKGLMIKEGSDVTILCTGIMTAESIKAAKMLKDVGIDAEVINIHTIKPLDVQMVLESAQKTGAVVTAENHSVIGGLGSAVSEVLSENYPVPVRRVGINDHFGEVGLTDFLMEKYGLTAEHIVAETKKAIELKR